MMALEWIRAGMAQLPLLCDTRIEVLRAANGLGPDVDMTDLRVATEAYYRAALPSGEHAAWLVMDQGEVVGTGGVSFFRVMPTCDVPTGRKAYVMNMYTAPGFRRRGVARRTLEMILQECRDRGVECITLEATAAGHPLYESCGFVPMGSEMIYQGK